MKYVALSILAIFLVLSWGIHVNFGRPFVEDISVNPIVFKDGTFVGTDHVARLSKYNWTGGKHTYLVYRFNNPDGTLGMLREDSFYFGPFRPKPPISQIKFNCDFPVQVSCELAPPDISGCSKGRPSTGWNSQLAYLGNQIRNEFQTSRLIPSNFFLD